MSLPWFRMYAEAVDDEKLRLLAFEDRWHFTALLCCKCQGIFDTPDEGLLRRKLALKLGVDLPTLDEIRRRLCEVGLTDDRLEPLRWDARQFSSDVSTDRVRKHRAMKRFAAVSETDQSRTEQSRTDSEDGAIPKRRPSKRCPPDFVLTDEMRQWAADKFPRVDIEAQTEAFRDYEFKHARRDWPATWRGWIRKAAEFKGGGAVQRGTHQQKPGRFEESTEQLREWARQHGADL